MVTKALPTYIPIKNVYQRAIPYLKQNVLSARISKHGIRSAVLSEPYVSTVKKLDLGLTGSSHYITVSDFFTICHYFKYKPPEVLMNFRFVRSSVPTDDVLEMFNQPQGVRGRELLQTLFSREGSVSSEGRASVGAASPAPRPRDDVNVAHDQAVLEG